MTQALPSVKSDRKFRLRAAIGGPLSLWSPLRNNWAELSWVLVGKLSFMAANAAVMLFLAHRLNLTIYGLLVISISGQLLISRFLILGVDVGMVRLTGIVELRSRSQEVVTAGLALIICTCSTLLVMLLLVSPLLSRFALPASVILSMVAGSIGSALVDYGYSFRLARHEYHLAAFAQGGTAMWRLGVTALIAVLLPAYPLAVFFAYHGASLFSGLAQAIPMAHKSWAWPDRALIKRLLRYSFWLGMANVIVILSFYQGTFLLMVLKQPQATGIFGLALTLSLGFFAIYTAYSEYLLVRIRSVEHMKALPRFLARAMAGALILAAGCLPVTIAVAVLMPWFLGPDWLEAVPIFLYLAVSMVLLIFQGPLVAACHYILKPQLVTFAWVLRTVLIGVFGLLLAPKMGATGVAIAQLIGSALALLVLGSLVAASLRTASAVET
jgi:O-antigen/teichoic acid export membrane protein